MNMSEERKMIVKSDWSAAGAPPQELRRIAAIEHLLGEPILERIVSSTETDDTVSYLVGKGGGLGDMILARKAALDTTASQLPPPKLS